MKMSDMFFEIRDIRNSNVTDYENFWICDFFDWKNLECYYLYIYRAWAFHELFEYVCRDSRNFRKFLGTWDIRKYISKNDFVRAVDAFA